LIGKEVGYTYEKLESITTQVHMFRSSRDAGKLLSDYLSENSSFVLFK
jgi:hypothetical protein